MPSSIDPISFYKFERGGRTWGNFPGQTCNDGYCPRKTEWTGKVALPYASDFGYSVSNNRDTCLYKSMHEWKNGICYPSSWLKKTKWLLDPNETTPTHALYTYEGQSYFIDAYRPWDVYPTVYLKPEVEIKGGSGAQSDPYIIG